MYHTRFFVYVVVLATVTQLSASQSRRLCSRRTPKQDIDFERLSKYDGVWYELIESAPTPITCWNYEKIRPTANGFNFTFHLYTEGGITQTSKGEFIRMKSGFYRMTEHIRTEFENRTMASIAHKAEKDIETMKTRNEAYLDWAYFFQTDYDNYLILGICMPGQGMVTYIKFREKSPKPQHVTEVWNFFSQHKSPVEVKWKQVCADWKKEL